MRAVLPLLLLFYSLTLKAQLTYFDFHPKAQAIYQQIFRLQLEPAEQALIRLQQQEPNNLITHHLANYIDFFRLYLSEDEKLLRQRLPQRQYRLEALKNGPENTPYRRYVEAEIRLHWALIRLRFEKYLPAFQDINRAHKLLLENQEQFPDFMPNLKDLGLLHAAVGTIPDQFKWGVKLLSSLKGTVEEGKRELERALTDRQSPYYLETAVLHVFLLLYLANEPEQAWKQLQNLPLDAADNPLHSFVLANVAMRTYRNDCALHYLNDRPRGREYYDFPYLDYLQGLALLRQLNPSARLHFQSYLLRFSGPHFVKEAHQKIGWAELLRGQPDAYRNRMRLLQTVGTTTAGGDADAQSEAERAELPHLGLLRARLLFDGGYFERARQELDQITPSHLANQRLQLEYYYRTGRVHDGAKRPDLALAFYERTIAGGNDHSFFYACSAALRAGLLEEDRGRSERAKHYFELCLSMKPDEYRTGLHLQAKAGLNRLRK